jgi:hypothetical protein
MHAEKAGWLHCRIKSRAAMRPVTGRDALLLVLQSAPQTSV